MLEIDQDIKSGQFKNAYLIYGEEDFLITTYRKKLINALDVADDTMNFARYSGKGISPGEIIDLAETLPFFKDRRVILIEDSGFFKEACDELAEYLKNVCESTCIIFVERSVDKRTRMYQAVKKYGCLAELKPYDADTLAKWIAGTLGKHGKKVRTSTVQYLISKSGTDMNLLAMEIRKLCDYTGDRDVIEDKDIDDICTVSLEDRIFEMTEAITEGNVKKALERYYELLSLRVAPIKIIALIAREFNLLLQAKELMHVARDQKALAARMGTAPWIAGKYMNRCRRLSSDYLREAFDAAVSTDQAIKSGLMDEKISIEMLICKYGVHTK